MIHDRRTRTYASLLIGRRFRGVFVPVTLVYGVYQSADFRHIADVKAHFTGTHSRNNQKIN